MHSYDVSSTDEYKSYPTQFDDSSTKYVPISDMLFITIKPPVVTKGNDQDALLLAFLQFGSKITFDHDGKFFKGYLGRKDGEYRLSFKRHPNVKQEEWGIAHTIPTAHLDQSVCWRNLTPWPPHVVVPL